MTTERTWEQMLQLISLKTEQHYPEIVTGKGATAKVSHLNMGGRERKRTCIDCGKKIRTRTAKRCIKCANHYRLPKMWKARRQKNLEKKMKLGLLLEVAERR